MGLEKHSFQKTFKWTYWQAEVWLAILIQGWHPETQLQRQENTGPKGTLVESNVPSVPRLLQRWHRLGLVTTLETGSGKEGS